MVSDLERGKVYRKSKAKTTRLLLKDDWNDFYRKIVTTTYQTLQRGGIYCLKIPIYIYDEVVVCIQPSQFDHAQISPSFSDLI
jgi:hypothetical protein